MRLLDDIEVIPQTEFPIGTGYDQTVTPGFKVFVCAVLEEGDFNHFGLDKDLSREALIYIPCSPYLCFKVDKIRVLYAGQECDLSKLHWLYRQGFTAQLSSIFKEVVPLHINTRSDGWHQPTLTATFWQSVLRDSIRPLTSLTVLPDPDGSHDFAQNLMRQTYDAMVGNQYLMLAEEFLARYEGVSALVDKIRLIREFVSIDVPILENTELVVHEKRSLIEERNSVTLISNTYYTQQHGLDRFGKEGWMEIIGSYCEKGLLRGSRNITDEYGNSIFHQYSTTTRERAISALQKAHFKIAS